MTYYLYHIPGKKIGVTRDLKERVENQQGYNEDEYVVLMETDDILEISNAEILMQKAFGYKVDTVPYNKLKFNNKTCWIEVNINGRKQRSPNTYGPTELWPKVMELYKFYYDKNVRK